MSCNNNLANPLPFCPEKITIGTLDNAYSALFIIFENITTGNRLIIPCQTGVDKVLIIEPTEPFALDCSYQVYVKEEIGDVDNIPMIIDGTTVDYFKTSFVRHFNQSGEIYSTAMATVSLQ